MSAKEDIQEKLNSSVDGMKRYIDNLLESLDASRTSGIDITFRVRPGEKVSVDVVLQSDSELLSK